MDIPVRCYQPAAAAPDSLGAWGVYSIQAFRQLFLPQRAPSRAFIPPLACSAIPRRTFTTTCACSIALPRALLLRRKLVDVFQGDAHLSVYQFFFPLVGAEMVLHNLATHDG